ncbi:MAG: metallophosphoesterase [Hyphomicrobiaceae bacterium]
MKPIVEPRKGDVDDDASSTKQRSLFSLAGALFAEISLPKLISAWILLIGLPAVLVGATPLVASIWLSGVSSQAFALLTGLWSLLVLLALMLAGWLGGRPLFRLAERSFWSLNALAVQPGYVLFREAVRHVVEMLLPARATDDRRSQARAISAAVAGLAICGIALWLVAWAWTSSRWLGSAADLASPHRLAVAALFNSVVLVSGYLAAAALLWGIADATMAQPRDRTSFHPTPAPERNWRIAHLSDIHTVGERYGFRIESGRAGAQGNERLERVFAQLSRIHAEDPFDAVLITGDITDAGRSAEWADFFDILEPYPELADRLLILPGNHDLNVVDRANPARLDLPTSPKKRLRQIRMLSALEALQGSRVRLVDGKQGQLGVSLSQALEPHRNEIAEFADRGGLHLSKRLADLWETLFPMVQPPTSDNGLGIILLNSNVEAHFSFTNALGMVSVEQAKAIEIVTRLYPRAVWIVALHHHVIEYPHRAKALSERIGTALINGSWFVRYLQDFAGRIVVMHGHRHIDWIGQCGGLTIVSAPSPVMEASARQETSFYIHTLAVAEGGRLDLMRPERVSVPGCSM